MTRIVVDANIFVSAILTPGSNSARLLDLVRENKVELLISEVILLEIQKVLKCPKIAKHHKRNREELKVFLDDYIRFATMTAGQRRVKVIKEDPDDDHYLECAREPHKTR
jgi:putative PIN family toxin of toxin-antitoxin system